ncbi:hypothetical protein Tco_0520687 [Tanacetum coccineum]
MSTSNTHQQSLANASFETRPPMLERVPYEFRIFTPSETEAPRMQKEEDLRGDDLKHYEADIEAMNLILISISNNIYNFMDACTTAKAMWQRVEHLIAKKLEKSHDPLALVAHMCSSSSYYVTHPSSVVDYDDDYQGDTIQNNSNDPLTSVMILLARAITLNLSNPTNNRLRTSSNTRNQAIIQGDRVNIQSKNFGTVANVLYGRCERAGVVRLEGPYGGIWARGEGCGRDESEALILYADSVLQSEPTDTPVNVRLQYLEMPQKQLSREQVYWLPANEVASYNCNQSKPVTNFVRTRPAKSQVNTQLKMLKACFPEFDKVVKDRTTPSYITNGEWRFEHTKKCFVEEIIPFYEKLKTHVKGIEDNLFKEVSEYMKIFDELDKEYDQCVIDKKSLEIENKNLLIQNECLLAESVSKDICSVVLTSDIAVPMSVEPRSNCVKEHSRNLELEAEILKVKQLLVEKEKRCSFIETKYQELELKFQKYKECFENPQVCNNSSSPELNVFFEINKLKDQLQGKDELIRKLKAQIGNMKEVSADPNLSTLEFQALETKNTQLKEELTAVRIKNDSLRDENVSIKKRYQDLYQSKAESNSNVSSRAAVPEKPKVLAPGLYAMTPKYIPPQKRNNREANTPLPKEREVASTKPHHMIAPGSSRYSSNDMVHNHYLEEAKKQTHEIGRNSKTSVIPSARSQSTANGSKPKPRINNQKSRNWPASKTSYVTTKTVPITEHSRNSRNFSDSKHFVCSTCQKCVFNTNHDHCVTKFLNEVNSRAKVSSNKTTNRNKPAEQISVAKKPERQISKGHRFSIKKTSIVYQKTMTPRSCLRWKPTVVPLEKSGSVSTSEPANNVIVITRFSKKPLTSYKRKDRKLKDISTGSPPNTETKVVNDPVNVNDLSTNQLNPNKNWISNVPNSTASSVFQCRSYREKNVTTAQTMTTAL